MHDLVTKLVEINQRGPYRRPDAEADVLKLLAAVRR